VTKLILTSSRPGDCIAFYPMDTRMPFRYYLPAGASAPRSVLPALPWSANPSFVEQYSTLSPAQVHGVAAGCNRVWLVSSHQGKGDATAGGQHHYLQFLLLRGEFGRVYHRWQTGAFGAQHLINVDLFSVRR
jgi:hypothetical protein